MAVFFSRLVMVLWLLAAPPLALAQIKIGQTAGLTGAVADSVKEATAGARLVFDEVNAAGGINGQRVELVSLDDKFDPKLAAANAKALIDQGVVALFLNRGTPHTEAIVPLLAAARIPLVAPSTGAMAFRQPVNPWIFNVRASYQREAEKVVHYLATVGVARIAIVQVDDSFGADATAGALRAFAAEKMKPAVHEKYDRSKPDFTAIVPKIIAADAQAVVFVGSGTAVVDGMKAVRAGGSRAQLVTLSNNASGGFIKGLGEMARGVIISQVFPSERSVAVPLVKAATDLATAKGLGELTPAMIEGVAAARVLVEGLRGAGKPATRAGLQAALERMHRVDIGGLEISYGPTSHAGLDYADLAIVGADGRFRR